MKTAAIVGSGLVGSLWAVYLAKAGYKINIFEARSDLRRSELSAGKSINLAMSARGWKALARVGLKEEIEKIAIPMYGRTMHDENSNLSYQAYGKEGQCIYSVSRGEINCLLMNKAEEISGTKIQFNQKCYAADEEKGIIYLENTRTGEKREVQSDYIFATDGAFSSVRYNVLLKLPRFDYSQKYIDDGYKEILLPANEDGTHKLSVNTLHIWPRGRFMLIALPNLGGSYTCTLFMPFEGHKYSFENINTKEEINSFFQEVFPDFFELMPDVAGHWGEFPLSALAIVRCYPWTVQKVALMGDAAHATVPFYGQGMNAGFEDCSVMWELMEEHKGDMPVVFKKYQKKRKPDGDAMQDLSLHNYRVMRDFVGNEKYLLQQKFETRISTLYPDKFIPLYSQVSFSHIRYFDALVNGKEQDKKIKAIMADNDIKQLFEINEIDNLIHTIIDTL